MHSMSHNRNRSVMVILLVFCLCLTGIPASQSRAASIKELDPPFETVMTNVGNYILSVDTNPGYSSIWNIIGLVRSGRVVSQEYKDTFYENTVRYLQDNNWQITRAKYSDYSKLILGMTAIGKDATNIGGHNLLEYLSDFNKVKLQGFNGPIWALIALKSHPSYTIPQVSGVVEQTTEEGLISYLLSKQLTEPGKEGWTLAGSRPDTDITGMTIQALAPYYGKRDDVTDAVDKALEWLSSAQNEHGGFSTLNGDGSVETSESDDQVIVALSSIGLDCRTDQRFIREDGSWVMSRLFEYYSSVATDKGGFLHILPGADNNGGATGSVDGIATAQGMYALDSYHRLQEGQTALYDMSDIEVSPGEPVEPSKPDEPDATTRKQEDTTRSSSATTQTKKEATKKKVKAVYLDYRQISLQKGKTRTLKATISPSNASNKKVKWTSSNKKIATVTQKGKVKGIKAGTAIITATARDGSKKKATCKVIVSGMISGNKTSTTEIGRSNTSGTYSNQKGGSQGNTSSSYYYPGGNSGQSSGASSTATKDATTATTEAGAWTYDGETYKADSGDTTGETDTVLDEEDYDSEMDESEEEEDEDFSEEESEEDDAESTIHLPAWLAIILGILSSGLLVGSFLVPWKTLRD